MDEATEGVTLFSGFVFDVLQEFEDTKRICAPAFAMADGLNPKTPEVPCAMDIYNNVCSWIEANVGTASIRSAGRAIGNRAYSQMIKDDSLPTEPTPHDIMRQLKRVASMMIQDPKGRGWEILDKSEHSIIMRRTQTFNCMLQEGLLMSLVERTGVLMPRVRHLRCTRKGDQYCDYEVSWTPEPHKRRMTRT